MPLPNFLIIGAQKSGTTWLARRLRQHPDIYIHDEEIHFFDKNYNFAKGLDWYAARFSSAVDKRAVGEKTPDYLWAHGRGVEGHTPWVHRNISDALPDARLIVLLRNPVERAVSALNHLICTGRISPFIDIDRLVVADKRNIIEGHGIMEYGMYYSQIMSYYEYFSPERILILVFEEDVVMNPAAGLRKACAFLGVDPSFVFSDLDRAENDAGASFLFLSLAWLLPFLRPYIGGVRGWFRPYRVRPGRVAMETLYRTYRDENKRLFELLGRTIPSWEMSGL